MKSYNSWAKLLAVTSLSLVSACDGQNANSRLIQSPEVDALSAMADTISGELDGDVVGYSFILNDLRTDRLISHANGQARLGADGGPLAMSPDRLMIIASVSKLLSTLGVMSVLQELGMSPETEIRPYLPTDWDVDPYVASLTFGQLLSHTSGIKDFGNGPKDYRDLQAFFTQPINHDADTACDGPWANTPQFGMTPSDQTYCYSNYNAAILQLLLPRLAGLDEDPNHVTRPLLLAQQFESLVQENVLQPVGVTNATCAPDQDDYALSYIFPGEAPGQDWGVQYNRCATGGWYISAEGMAEVLSSMANRDGRILVENDDYSSLDAIRENGFGLDRNTPAMIEKSGVLGEDRGVLSASAMIRFSQDGAPHLVAVLFINSTNSEIRIEHARPVLERAYEAAFGEVFSE